MFIADWTSFETGGFESGDPLGLVCSLHGWESDPIPSPKKQSCPNWCCTACACDSMFLFF